MPDEPAPGAEPEAQRIKVECHGPGRLLITLSRRQSRAFSVSLAEAELLAGLLRQRLGEQPTGSARLTTAAGRCFPAAGSKFGPAISGALKVPADGWSSSAGTFR